MCLCLDGVAAQFLVGHLFPALLFHTQLWFRCLVLFSCLAFATITILLPQWFGRFDESARFIVRIVQLLALSYINQLTARPVTDSPHRLVDALRSNFTTAKLAKQLREIQKAVLSFFYNEVLSVKPVRKLLRNPVIVSEFVAHEVGYCLIKGEVKKNTSPVAGFFLNFQPA